MSNSIRRIGVEDPRMAKIVIHGGVVYLSGQVDMTKDDSTWEKDVNFDYCIILYCVWTSNLTLAFLSPSP